MSAQPAAPKPREAALAAWLARAGALLLALAVVLPVLIQLPESRGRIPSWSGGDLDTALLHAGLVTAPRFADTLKWWAGPWVAGPVVPFYRPLTSLLFWTEWKLFGSAEWLYGYPALLAHLLAALLFAEVAFQLAVRLGVRAPVVAALAAAWMFLGLHSPDTERQPVVALVSRLWKNQPDSWAAICACLALLASMRPGAGWRGAALPAAWYLAACCFKEVAVPLPLVFGALALPELRRNRRAAVARLLPTAAAAGLFLVFRGQALGGIGYTYGSNSAWLERTAVHALGPFGSMVTGQWLGLAVLAWIGAVTACAVWWLRRSRGRAVLYVLAVTALAGSGILGACELSSRGWDEAPTRNPAAGWVAGLLYVFGAREGPWMAVLAYAVATAGALWRRSRTAVAVGLVWAEALQAPLALSPGPAHRYYLPEAGFLLIYALGTAELTARVGGWIAARRGVCAGAASAGRREVATERGAGPGACGAGPPRGTLPGAADEVAGT